MPSVSFHSGESELADTEICISFSTRQCHPIWNLNQIFRRALWFTTLQSLSLWTMIFFLIDSGFRIFFWFIPNYNLTFKKVEILMQSWRREVQGQGIGRADFFSGLSPWLTDGHLHSVSSHVLLCARQLLFSPHKEISHFGLWLT